MTRAGVFQAPPCTPNITIVEEDIRNRLDLCASSPSLLHLIVLLQLVLLLLLLQLVLLVLLILVLLLVLLRVLLVLVLLVLLVLLLLLPSSFLPLPLLLCVVVSCSDGLYCRLCSGLTVQTS